MSPSEYAFIGVAGIFAGLSGTVTGIASLFSYPALLYVGLAPVTANITNTISMFATTVGAAVGSRPELRGQGRRIAVLAVTAGTGGAFGAALLLSTPSDAFERIVPWLIATGAVVLLLRDRIRAWAERRSQRRTTAASPVPGLALVVVVGVYGGYFGAAAGVLMLAVISASVTEPLPVSNAVKNMTTGSANLVASVAYVVLTPVSWGAVAALSAGAVVGSWIGPAVVRRVPERPLRFVIAVAGFGLAIQLWASA